VRRLLAVLCVAAACAAAAARAADPSPRQEKLDEARAMLDYGLWNGRIDALYDLGDMGRDGVPLLAYADDDADWQVRLTAVHFLGEAGAPAAPALAAVALREPCPHVRLFALLWLSRMGAAGEPGYRAAATPEDEAALARLPERYNPGFMGKPLVIDAPDEMNAEFFNGGADLRVCASSEHAGRLHEPLGSPGGGSDSASHEAVVTADVPSWAIGGGSRAAGGRSGKPESMPPGPPAPGAAEASLAARETPEQERRAAELDALLAPGSPETLPPGPPAAAPRAAPAAEAPRYESPDARLLAAGSMPASRPGAPQALPPGLPAPEARAPDAGEAAFVADAGTGKPERDPIPVLIEQLSASNPRGRARAADELGKRGAAAARAVPALRRALSDRDRRVRASAVLALGSAGAGAKGVAADLRRALRDKDEDVRFSAGIALERLRRR
jgi:HEAT repeat protein